MDKKPEKAAMEIVTLNGEQVLVAKLPKALKAGDYDLECTINPSGGSPEGCTVYFHCGTFHILPR